MSDCTHVTLFVHPEDLNHPGWEDWIEEMGPSEEEHSYPGFWFGSEVNYAAYSALQELANKEVRFIGEHGSGCDYDGQEFFHDGYTDIFYSPSDLWSTGHIVVPVQEGKVSNWDIELKLSIINRYSNFWRTINNAISACS